MILESNNDVRDQQLQLILQPNEQHNKLNDQPVCVVNDGKWMIFTI